jgi:hypothetical protein
MAFAVSQLFLDTHLSLPETFYQLLLSALAAIELASPGACELVFSYRPLQL